MQPKVLSTKPVYKGRVFELKNVYLKAPDGRKIKHGVIFHPGASVIIPIMDRNHVVLIKQYRTSVRRAIWEFPAGTLEKGELPLACAKREIIEETGYEAKKWRKLGSFYPAPGISTEYMHIFLAWGLTPKKMMLDKDEFLKEYIISFSRLQNMILNGIIVDAKTILGF